MYYEQLNQIFQSLANPIEAQGMSAYMKNHFLFYGIKSPIRKEASKEILSQLKKEKEIQWDFVHKCWENPHREFQYVALEYLKSIKKRLTPDDMPSLKNLALQKSWWDSIDVFDRVIGDIVLRNHELEQLMIEWSLDENFWLRRIAIDHQLLRKSDTNTSLLKTIILNNLGQKEFFINKAIGWSLRDYSKTNPDWVRNFVEKYKNELSNLSIREATKYL